MKLLIHIVLCIIMVSLVNGRSLIKFRKRRATEDCKIDVVTTSWSTGQNGQLRVKMPSDIKVNDAIVVIVGFNGPVTSFRAWGSCLGLTNNLNEEDNEADIDFTVLQWMMNSKCVGPDVVMTFGYTLNYNGGESSSIDYVSILVNDEDADDGANQCGEEGEEGEEGGEGEVEVGAQIVTGNVTCDKLFTVTADRPGQTEGYIEFISPVTNEDFEIEVGLDQPSNDLVLNGLQKDDESECEEVEGRVHFFTKTQKLVKGQTVRSSFNLNYDQNGVQPKIEGVGVFVGDEEIYCGDIALCPEEEGEEKKDVVV